MSVTITQTETETRDTRVVARTHGTVLGPGNSPSRVAVLPLPSQREARISNSLVSLGVAGREAANRIHEATIEILRGQLRNSGLPRREIDAWTLQFDALGSERGEERARLIATLVSRNLYPALLEEISDQQQDQLLELEETCRKILSQLLPSGSQGVDPFLEEEAIPPSSAAIPAATSNVTIQTLIEQLRNSGLPQGEIDEWMQEFEREEARAPLIAILILRTLHPAVLREVNPDQQDRLLELEETCREILSQLLPSGSQGVDPFLERIRSGLEEERVFRGSGPIVWAAAQAEIGALNNVSREIEGKIRAAFERIRQRLIELQKERRSIDSSIDAVVERLDGQIAELSSALASMATRIQGLGAMSPEFKRTLKECETVLARLR